jgi:HEPN domain-containing protein
VKQSREEALRWLEQAEHNLNVAKHDLEADFYSDTCFMAEQAAQVALKAFLICHKKRFVSQHSIQELAKLSAQYNKNFEIFIEYGKVLDRYYIPTRYPDALARGSVPYKTFTHKDANEALKFAEEILNKVRQEIQGPTKKNK